MLLRSSTAIDYAVDLSEQVFPADIALQVNSGNFGRGFVVQGLPYQFQVVRVANVYLERPVAVQVGLRVTHQAVTFVQQAGNITQRLTQLTGDLVFMVGLVPNNTGRAGDQELLGAIEAQNGASRKQRALGAVLARITPGTDLSRVFHIQAGQGSSKKIHLQCVLVGGGADGGRCRQGRSVARVDQYSLGAAQAELAIATIFIAMDGNFSSSTARSAYNISSSFNAFNR